MRKKIRITLLILFLIILGSLIYKFSNTLKNKETVGEVISKLPNFEFRTLDNFSFSNDDLKIETKKILVYFNSECDSCQNEASKFAHNLNQMADCEILYISSETPDKILKFAKKYKLSNFKNIIFLHDIENTFPKWVNTSSVPYILAYDNKDNLLYQKKGVGNISELIKSLKNGTE